MNFQERAAIHRDIQDLKKRYFSACAQVRHHRANPVKQERFRKEAREARDLRLLLRKRLEQDRAQA